ncbi:MAG: argininosuccinate lyase [Flavobacteriaceae bacterium]|tara:strand:+ start:332 stop:1615 length:1284 start_codon:yes stop_codon:yes gene_type:complete
MKLWEEKDKKRNEIIDQFTVGKDRYYDTLLAKYDCKASIAHSKMLAKVNILSKNESDKLNKVLYEIIDEIKKGEFEIEDEFEDMHSKIEFVLIQKLGDLGKKIHTARSRNDQVLVAIQLFVKDELNSIKKEIHSLFNILIKLSEKYKSYIIPGYTHMQLAMPSSFGLWFSAYAETLIDDIISINNALSIVDQNPLGSAAGYGTSFPIDRKSTTKSLNFSELKYNSLAAQISRGKIEKQTLSAISSLSSTVSKFCMDICLYMGQDFNFISFPDDLTTGSSIMPHKKNPDIFELIRGKCNIIQSLPNQINLLTTNLPSGYHREMQLTKGPLIESINEIKSCLKIFNHSIKKIIINKNIIDNPKYDYLFTVDSLNKWVMKGIPFRDAYKKMKLEIKNKNYIPNKKLKHTHVGSIGNLNLNDIKIKMKKYY